MRINLSQFFCLAVGIQRQLVLTAILLLFVAVSQGAEPKVNRLFLTWDNQPDYDTNITFFVFASPEVATPAAQWANVTNLDFITFTNAAKLAGELGRVEIPAATDVRQFYVVAASNVTGMSDFSEVVSVRRVEPPTKLRLGVIQ